MRLHTHRMTEATFLALASGGGGPAAVGQLVLARRSRNLMLLRALVTRAVASEHPEALAAYTAYRSLATIERQVPDAVATVLHYPSVAAWMLSTVRQLGAGRGSVVRPGLLAAVAAAAALRGAVTCDVDLSPAMRSDHRITLPSLGRITVPGSGRDSVTLRCRAAGAEVCTNQGNVPLPIDLRQAGHGWRALPRVWAECAGQRLDVVLDMLEPTEGTGPAVDEEELRDPHKVELWNTRVVEGWGLLAHHHHEVAAEIAAAVTVLAPLSTSAGGFVSGTPSNAFGCIAMSLPQDAVTAALTFAHEMQHVKLTAITDLFPLVEPGSQVLCYAPWRADPRPVLGLLHGTYAHLGVVGFWRRQRDHPVGFEALHAHTEFARWRTAARDVAQFLSRSSQLTPLGNRFAQRMLTTLEEWINEDVPVQAVKTAERLAREHRTAWCAVHGDLSF